MRVRERGGEGAHVGVEAEEQIEGPFQRAWETEMERDRQCGRQAGAELADGARDDGERWRHGGEEEESGEHKRRASVVRVCWVTVGSSLLSPRLLSSRSCLAS